ncbi:MAG: winged helix DNA-binding domain-containing protein [Bacteroidota bacterium]
MITSSAFTSLRLFNQHISGTPYTKPGELLSFMGAMQAQDYAQAKWAVGLRLPGTTGADIEKAIVRKQIVRTWAMRGTLQFVAAKDYRWLHSLFTSKFLNTNSSRNRQLGLDGKIFNKANSLIVKSLEMEKLLTRSEIGKILKTSGIATDQNRLSHILHFATMNQLICFGPRKEKEFSFVLLDDWIPSPKTLPRTKALGELAKRYFISRGPATLQDFIWWSGLSAADAKTSLETVSHLLIRESFNGKEYFLSNDATDSKHLDGGANRIFLLAGFDEYLISYTDRSASLNPKFNAKAIYNNGIFHPTIVMGGQIVGIWRPIVKGKSITMRSEYFTKMTTTQLKSVDEEFQKYILFAKDLSDT